MEGQKLAVAIIALAAVGLPGIIRLLMILQKHLADSAKSDKRIAHG
jgi:hypothetical protein